MLTRLRVRNFKRFQELDIELGEAVVFIGPNNSGKTSALQALALWELGLRRWIEKRGGRETPERRPGVTINRRDLISVPIPDANLLWRHLHVRDVRRVDGRPQTRNIRIDVTVEGVTEGRPWACGLEFDYANEESIYCRPLLVEGSRMEIPAHARTVQVAYLPPMSGLSPNESRLDPGAIAVRIGEGRTAEVLRNLSHRLHSERPALWEQLCRRVRDYFGVSLEAPVYVPERGEVEMTYRDRGARLDLSCSGRGLQQTLLLLSYLYTNPGAALLLDEPDAHLEILRQRQMYQMITEVARSQGSQVVAASHSEVVLGEAADRDIVVAFVGAPHRIDDRGSHVAKSLKEIGFDQYYQAEQTGWVLYLEGSTDLAVLQAFARILGHRAAHHLERPFVHYVANQLRRAESHFHGLKVAKADLVGFLLLDRTELPSGRHPDLTVRSWTRREIENYLCAPEVLLAFAEGSADEEVPGPLFASAERGRRRSIMEELLRDQVPPVALRDLSHPYWRDTKASDVLLDPLFEAYFERLELKNLMRKTDYHVLAERVPKHGIDPEVVLVLDAIVEVAERARPLADPEEGPEAPRPG